MNLTDAIDIASELMPRQGKRLVSMVLLLLCVFSAGTVVHIVQWYARESSQVIVQEV